jgi:FkbM family methyltransferase
MTGLIERDLPDGRSVADILFAGFDRTGGILNFVDVGARNGSYLLPESYATRCRITGFEPNRDEYEKLVNGQTDARAAGLVEPHFKGRRYFPHALWSSSGERTLQVTAGVGAATLMGPVNERVAKNMWREQDGGRNFFERVQRVVETNMVNCVTLDQILSESSETIDILKLDVEGAELDVLEGARHLLEKKSILVIFSEFLFVPLYERRVTLGHQQVFLEDLGYRLIALNFDHFPYSWGRTRICSTDAQRLTYSGDAIFVLDPDRNKLDGDTMYRLGLASFALGFSALGLNLIEASGRLLSNDKLAIENLANLRSVSRKLRDAWMEVPNVGYRVLKLFGMRK